MKTKLGIILALLLASFSLTAQVRTDSDIDAGNFVLGSDGCVICDGAGASLAFSTKGYVFEAHGSGSLVEVKDLQTGKRMTVYNGGLAVPAKGSAVSVGGGERISLAYHDFTGDSNPEFIIAVVGTGGFAAYILEFGSSTWTSIGELSATGATECRIFRQVLTMRDDSTDTLHTWTWRGGSFDYRSSK